MNIKVVQLIKINNFYFVIFSSDKVIVTLFNSRIPFSCAHNTSILSSPCRVALLHPRPEALRAPRSGEQASGTRRLASRHLRLVERQIVPILFA